MLLDTHSADRNQQGTTQQGTTQQGSTQQGTTQTRVYICLRYVITKADRKGQRRR